MKFEREDELRMKYSLITRGFLTLRNHIDAALTMNLPDMPRVDDATRRQILAIVDHASKRGMNSEIEALCAEYGPDARHVLT